MSTLSWGDIHQYPGKILSSTKVSMLTDNLQQFKIKMDGYFQKAQHYISLLYAKLSLAYGLAIFFLRQWYHFLCQTLTRVLCFSYERYVSTSITLCVHFVELLVKCAYDGTNWNYLITKIDLETASLQNTGILILRKAWASECTYNLNIANIGIGNCFVGIVVDSLWKKWKWCYSFCSR